MRSIPKLFSLLMPLLLCVLIEASEGLSRQKDSSRQGHPQTNLNPYSPMALFRVRRTFVNANENCGPHELEMVHTIMDRICMLCHELRSHFAPNTRVECRSNCFRNESFQSCMRIFSGVPSKAVQQAEPTAPVPLYTENVPTLDDIKERRRRI